MAEPRTVIVTHWRIVSDETGGIRYSISNREDVDAFDRCIAMYERIGHGCHVEQWEETYTVTPSTWWRVWPLQCNREVKATNG